MRRLPLVAAVLFVLALLAGPGRAADITGVVYNPSTGHYYKHYTTATTWASAKSAAESVGGYLAVITSQAENDWVKANVATSGTPWLGGTDETTEGTWVWITGETWSWTYWGPGEPNNSGNEDYLQFRTDGQWNDVPGGNSYTYVVEWNSDPNGPPEIPTSLSATAVSDAQVNLSWTDPSSRETGFEIERAVGVGAFEALTSPASNVVSFADMDVTAETLYSYRIRSVGTGGASEWSDIASVTTPPPPPIGLTTTVLSSSRVELKWTNVASTATSIEVERGVGTPGTGFAVKGTTSGTATLFTDTTAVPETTHAYRVRAVGPGGKSRYSQEAYATMPPASPSGLGLSAVSDTRVVLGWDDNSMIETGFDIERGDGWPTAKFSPLASVDANIRAFADDGVKAETTYTYRVRAHNDSGASDWSVEGHVTTQPRTPANLAAQALSASRMRVTWSDVSARESGFEIQRALDSDGLFRHLADVDFGVQEYLDLTARQEILYRYRVSATSLTGQSNWIEVTAPRMPAILVVRRISVTQPKVRKTAKAAALPKLVLLGEFDVGGRDLDLFTTATFSLGEATVELPVPSRKGKAIRFQTDEILMDLKPSPTSSRVTFQFQAVGDLATGLPADGPATIAYANGDFRAVGTVRLAGGGFLPPQHGDFGDPSCNVVSASLSLKPGEKDAYTLRMAFDASGGVPEIVPQLSVLVGSSQFLSTSGQFQRVKDRLVLKEKVAGGTRSVTLDYAKGLATISVKGGIEIGTFGKGPAPVFVAVTFGALSYEDTLTMSSTGKSAKY